MAPFPGTLHPCGDLEEALGFQLWISSVLAIADIWKVHQWMGNLLSLFFLLSVNLPLKKLNKYLVKMPLWVDDNRGL